MYVTVSSTVVWHGELYIVSNSNYGFNREATNQYSMYIHNNKHYALPATSICGGIINVIVAHTVKH